MTIKVQMEGLTETLRKLEGKPIYAEPWKRALERAVQILLGKLREESPRLSNQLANSWTGRLDSREVPRFGEVKTDQTASDGFRYPHALNASKRIRYRFQSGTRRGQLLYRWTLRSQRAVREQLQSLLSAAEREIESAWQR